jgi:hypothetical protein
MGKLLKLIPKKTLMEVSFLSFVIIHVVDDQIMSLTDELVLRQAAPKDHEHRMLHLKFVAEGVTCLSIAF